MSKIVEIYEFETTLSPHKKVRNGYQLKLVLPIELSLKLQHLIHRKVKVMIYVPES